MPLKCHFATSGDRNKVTARAKCHSGATFTHPGGRTHRIAPSPAGDTSPPSSGNTTFLPCFAMTRRRINTTIIYGEQKITMKKLVKMTSGVLTYMLSLAALAAS